MQLRREVKNLRLYRRMVTALRTDVDIVVTEFGVERIKDLPVKERGRALVEIAAPEFRDELLADPLFD